MTPDNFKPDDLAQKPAHPADQEAAIRRWALQGKRPTWAPPLPAAEARPGPAVDEEMRAAVEEQAERIDRLEALARELAAEQVKRAEALDEKIERLETLLEQLLAQQD